MSAELLVGLAAGLLVGALIGAALRRPPKEDADAPGKELFQLLVETTPVALLLYADDGRIVFANHAANALFAEGETLVGQNFLGLVAAAPAALKEALLGEAQLFTLDVEGQAETYQLSRRDVRFAGGSHVLLLVNHLTREVSRREVEVLKKVIRVISHELNNSLATIQSLLGSARFIAEHPEHAGRLGEVLGSVEERAKHLQAFLGSYAELARMPRPRKRALDWAPLLKHLTDLFPALTLPEDPAALSETHADLTQLEQLMINLVKNAFEAQGSDGRDPAHAAEVELRVEAREDGGVDLRILDRGPGFSDEALRNGLLPFYTTKPGGSGMGLALCREIAEGHGGSLGIRAREGGGSAVTCSLPPKHELPASQRAQLTLTRA
ncbi:MAG: HAMP domain-containing sensor histidine kinase [Myxococcota bacterium]